MHSRVDTGLLSSPMRFFQETRSSQSGDIQEDDTHTTIATIRHEITSSPTPKEIVIQKIQDAAKILGNKIDAAKTPEELVSAISAWEKSLDLLSQALPNQMEHLRKTFADEIGKALLGDKRDRFHVTIHGHEHVTNRAKLLMQYGDEIRNLRGYDSTTGLLAIGILIVQTLLASLVKDTSWPNFLLVMLLIGSVLNHSAGMIIHEASHNLAAPTPILNRLVSVVANLPFGIPHQASFERYHLQHHLYLGQPDRDNDLPPPALAHWVGNSTVKKALWLAFYPLAYGITQRPEKPTWKQIANILIQLGWDAGIVYFLGPWSLAYMIGSTLLGFSALNPVSAHWIDEHFLRDEDGQETHSYYGLLNLLNFNVGYHNEHHDITDIPGSRLPELHRIANDHYGNQRGGRSWLNTIWQFITDPNISAHSRIIRSAKSQHQKNATILSERSAQKSGENLGLIRR